jgi:hypothetical protein
MWPIGKLTWLIPIAIGIPPDLRMRSVKVLAIFSKGALQIHFAICMEMLKVFIPGGHSAFRTSKINNSGWRIDYFLVSNRIADRVLKSEMIDSGPRQDHTPIILEIDL